jgi:hypothetical protein
MFTTEMHGHDRRRQGLSMVAPCRLARAQTVAGAVNPSSPDRSCHGRSPVARPPSGGSGVTPALLAYADTGSRFDTMSIRPEGIPSWQP